MEKPYEKSKKDSSNVQDLNIQNNLSYSPWASAPTLPPRNYSIEKLLEASKMTFDKVIELAGKLDEQIKKDNPGASFQSYKEYFTAYSIEHMANSYQASAIGALTVDASENKEFSKASLNLLDNALKYGFWPSFRAQLATELEKKSSELSSKGNSKGAKQLLDLATKIAKGTIYNHADDKEHPWQFNF